MPAGTGYRVRRAAVSPEPLLGGSRADYADAFVVELDAPDAHSPEQWAKAALEGASPVVRGIIRLAQVRVLRLRLRPRTDKQAVLGWPVRASTSEAFHLRADGPLVAGDIVGRRTSPRRIVVTTSLVFERRLARPVWMLVGPLHRRVAAYLLRRAAASLTAGARRR